MSAAPLHRRGFLSCGRLTHHRAPIIDSARGRVDGANLGQGGGDAQGDQRDEDPAVEDGDALSVRQGDVQGRRQSERNCGSDLTLSIVSF